MNRENEYISRVLPACVHDAMERFFDAGEDIFLVGGSLRDILMGRSPNDFDLATSAPPNKTASLFSDMRVIETGIKHGTVTVIYGEMPLEITTFRIDGGYTDARHPDSVSFTCRVEEDLARRDFTVNAIAFNRQRGLVDPFRGKADIEKKLLRAVGDPYARFSEDALRIMRLFRFSAQLGFDIEKNTLLGACAKKEGLLNIARERIASELLKLLCSADPAKSLGLMSDTGALQTVTGGYIPTQKIFAGLSKMPPDETARLGLFISELYFKDEARAEALLSELKLSNKLKKGALSVAKGSHTKIENERDVRRLLADHGAYAYFAACASAVLGCCTDACLKSVSACNAPCSISELAVRGNELTEVGIEGKAVGETLRALLCAVIDDPELNRKEALLALAKEIYKKTRETEK